MKKLFIVLTALVLSLTLSACTGTVEADMMSSKNALSVLSYISASFLDESVESDVVVSTEFLKLNVTTEETSEDAQTEIEDELEQVNIYMDKLKSFIEFGAAGFGSIEEEISDRPEYLFLMRISIEESEFLLYYNIDIETNQITGLFVLDGVEYTITAENSLMDADEFEDDEDDVDTETEDDDEDVDTETDDEDDQGGATTEPNTDGIDPVSNELDDDDEDELEDEDEFENEEEFEDEDEFEDHDDENEVKHRMRLVATNGDDSIVIEYEVKQEDNESEESFHIEKRIGGIESQVEINIKVEDDEYVLEIKEDGNEYKFKVEQESDTEVEYKLEYQVDGVDGEVKITVTTNELGETTYTYDISEDGEEVEIEMEDPDDDDEYEDEHEDEDEEDEETEM